jgi:hypothetical protein
MNDTDVMNDTEKMLGNWLLAVAELSTTTIDAASDALRAGLSSVAAAILKLGGEAQRLTTEKCRADITAELVKRGANADVG